jgi:signal transduction histidine kinase
MKRFWARSLSGQFICAMLIALALAQAVSLAVYRYESSRRMRTVLREEFLGRAASAYRLAEATPSEQRAETLQAAATPLARYWLTAHPPNEIEHWHELARAWLLQPLPAVDKQHPPSSLFSHEPILDVRPAGTWQRLPPEAWLLRVPLQVLEIPEWNGFGLVIQLDDGMWLNVVYAKPRSLVNAPTSLRSYAALATIALVFSVGAWLIARRISRPLRQLTHATERLGRGEELAPLPEEGPEDIRSTIATFNRMQVRLRRFVEDRTRMLAAIGHDLRTPITTLRLRAEFVSDGETREKLLATIAEMEAMTEATLAFARSESAAESTRVVDVSALLESLCDDLSELGWPVEFSPNGRVPCTCRPDALRRALRNVIENAVRYGDRARVALHAQRESIDILVEDDGPGIAAPDRERVFAPFVRLEVSRNRNTGGVGLGLAIARTILRSHGGDILLGEGERGLRVKLVLPRD